MANSPVISSLSTYVDQQRDPIVSTSLLGGKSARIFAHQAGVKGTAALNLLATSVEFGNGDACGWSEAGTSTFTQRNIVTGAIKINMAYCEKKLRKYWMGYQVDVKAGLEKLPFEEKFANDVVAMVQEALETAIWQGDTTSSSANLKYFDGLLKTLNADVPSGNKETIASGSTYLAAVKQVLLAMPAKTLKEDAVIFCAPEFLRNYEQALVTANLYHFEPGKDIDDITIPGSNVKLVAVPGLASQSKLVGGRLSNFFFGFDIEDAVETLKSWYSEDNDEFRFRMWFNAGVQVAFPSEIILGTYTTLA